MYEAASFTFNCSGDMYERDYFSKWHHYISDQKTNYFKYYDDYVGAVKIDFVGYDDKIQHTVILEQAWPASFDAQALDYSNDEVLTLTVNFEYKKWRIPDEK